MVRDRYDDNSYRRAVARACDKADAAARKQRREAMAKQGIELDPADDVRIVLRWHPNQLRHTAATRLRKQFGLATARVILGHQSRPTVFTPAVRVVRIESSWTSRNPGTDARRDGAAHGGYGRERGAPVSCADL